MPEQPQTFGPNAWLVDEMYEQFRRDPSSVSESWREFFADYKPATANGSGQTQAPAASPAKPQSAPAPPATTSRPFVAESATNDRKVGPGAAPGAQAAKAKVDEPVTPLKGAAAATARNMEASLGVPTATSFRVVPARLLEVNRRILNNFLARKGGGKISFTHLIGYAV